MSRRRIFAVMYGLLVGIAFAVGVFAAFLVVMYGLLVGIAFAVEMFAASGPTTRLYLAAIVGVETVLLAWIAMLGWRSLNRRIALAVLFVSLAGLAVAVGVWCLLPVAKSAAIVRLQVRSPPATQKQQIAIAKSRFVINDAVQRLDPALLARVYSPVGDQEPVEWLERLLTIDFKAGPEVMSMTLTGDARDEADLGIIVGAVAEAYRTQLLKANAKAEVKLLGDPTITQGNDRKRRTIFSVVAELGTLVAALFATMAWRVWRSRGPTLGPLGAT
jgi:hypothetical protein